jgi:aspartyl-tRNA(Asn)/glutamyl-tRNA(Gln) amidotransferase subunit A
MTELWRLPITALAERLRSGDLSPLELLEAYLDRIERHDAALGAFVHLNPDAGAAATAAGEAIQAGRWLGPLHGVPIAIKDNYATADMPTLAGSTVPLGWPREDASSVARLRAAGAVLIGKTRMHEFAWGMETPPARNPRDLSRVPGGSSGGSGVAVAAGFAAAALGSDTGGSIRIPASLCGCVGLKPTFGLIGRGGIVPHSWSLDHAGPLAGSVADAALLTAAMTGPDPADPGARGQEPGDWSEALAAGVAGMVVGVCRTHFFEGLDPEIEAAAERSIDRLAKAGARVVAFEVPELAAALGAIFAIELASSTTFHLQRLRNGSVSQCAPDVRLLVEMGSLVTAVDYLQAERYRRHLGERFAKIFGEVDVIVTPTMPLTAWRIGQREVAIGGRPESVLAVSWRLTHPWNLLGVPAISVPCGSDGAGLPIGVQIAAAPFGEATMLRAAAELERASGGPALRCSWTPRSTAL